MDNIGNNVAKSTPMYRYLALDESGRIQGILLSSTYEPDRTDLMLIPDDYAPQATITFGWRIAEDGLWYPPEPPTEEQTLEAEVQGLKIELQSMYTQEQYENWLGDDATALLSASATSGAKQTASEPEAPAANLLVAFGRLAEEYDPEMAEAATFAQNVMAYTMDIQPTQAPKTKADLLTELSEKISRLEEIRAGN